MPGLAVPLATPAPAAAGPARSWPPRREAGTTYVCRVAKGAAVTGRAEPIPGDFEKVELDVAPVASTGTAIFAGGLSAGLVAGGRADRPGPDLRPDRLQPPVGGGGDPLHAGAGLRHQVLPGWTPCSAWRSPGPGRGLYPIFGTLLGWLGVALTGSDTSSNVLFGNLQRITAEKLGLNPVLMASANSTGGVMGKMIDAQSIVVAAAATGEQGQEGDHPPGRLPPQPGPGPDRRGDRLGLCDRRPRRRPDNPPALTRSDPIAGGLPMDRPRAVFLDKDGTLVVDVPYNVDPSQIRLTPGAAEGVRLLREAGYRLAIVTNQSGVARGYFPESALPAVWERLRELLDAEGGGFDAVRYCPHHPRGVVPAYAGACDCRKPMPGLLHRAAADLGVDPADAWMVGDEPKDVEAGRRAGCRTVLVGRAEAFVPLRTPDLVALDLADAARQILAADAGR